MNPLLLIFVIVGIVVVAEVVLFVVRLSFGLTFIGIGSDVSISTMSLSCAGGRAGDGIGGEDEADASEEGVRSSAIVF